MCPHVRSTPAPVSRRPSAAPPASCSPAPVTRTRHPPPASVGQRLQSPVHTRNVASVTAPCPLLMKLTSPQLFTTTSAAFVTTNVKSLVKGSKIPSFEDSFWRAGQRTKTSAKRVVHKSDCLIIQYLQTHSKTCDIRCLNESCPAVEAEAGTTTAGQVTKCRTSLPGKFPNFYS